MTKARHILLGTAALLAAGVGAHAADLPMAEPVQYVRICNASGEGFFYIPGSQTCLRISGYARADVQYQEPVFGRADSAISFRTRARIDLDARTQTGWGTLRAFIRLQSDWSSDNTRGLGIDPIRQNSNIYLGSSDIADNGFYAEKAFVQFGGLTAGLATSFFDFYANANVLSFVGGSDLSVPLLGYTASFGNGFSATVAIEDRAPREADLIAPFGPAGNIYAGQTMPDFVGNLRVEQGWGSAQLSGAVHQLRSLSLAGIGIPDTEYGFAVQAGVSVNLPMIAAGDTLTLQAAYAEGAGSYLGVTGNTLAGIPSGVLDGFVFGAPARIAEISGYTLVGEFVHHWTPGLRSIFAASYSGLDVPAPFVDFRSFRGTGALVWSPVADLDLGVELAYDRTNVSGGFGNFDRVSGIFRVERRF